MNALEQERSARVDHEILLANWAGAQDEPARRFIEQLLQKSLIYVRGLMLSQAMNLCSVPHLPKRRMRDPQRQAMVFPTRSRPAK
jgi:hypothetical protein